MEIWTILTRSFLASRERINGFETKGKEISMDSYPLICTKTNFRWIKYFKSWKYWKKVNLCIYILKFGRCLWLGNKNPKAIHIHIQYKAMKICCSVKVKKVQQSNYKNNLYTYCRRLFFFLIYKILLYANKQNDGQHHRNRLLTVKEI